MHTYIKAKEGRTKSTVKGTGETLCMFLIRSIWISLSYGENVDRFLVGPIMLDHTGQTVREYMDWHKWELKLTGSALGDLSIAAFLERAAELAFPGSSLGFAQYGTQKSSKILKRDFESSLHDEELRDTIWYANTEMASSKSGLNPIEHVGDELWKVLGDSRPSLSFEIL